MYELLNPESLGCLYWKYITQWAVWVCQVLWHHRSRPEQDHPAAPDFYLHSVSLHAAFDVLTRPGVSRTGPGRFRRFPAPDSDERVVNGPEWRADGDTFIWIRCAEAGKHLICVGLEFSTPAPGAGSKSESISIKPTLKCSTTEINQKKKHLMK